MNLYTDGGVIGVNPSPYGGTWAWCLVKNNAIVHSHSGVVTHKNHGLLTTSNNLTELLAAVEGLEYIQSNYRGFVDVFTDSEVTKFRLEGSKQLKGIPLSLKKRLRKVRCVVNSVTLLGGHPTKIELANKVRRDGKPVSQWNVWADKRCRLLAKQFMENLDE